MLETNEKRTKLMVRKVLKLSSIVTWKGKIEIRSVRSGQDKRQRKQACKQQINVNIAVRGIFLLFP